MMKLLCTTIRLFRFMKTWERFNLITSRLVERITNQLLQHWRILQFFTKLMQMRLEYELEHKVICRAWIGLNTWWKRKMYFRILKIGKNHDCGHAVVLLVFVCCISVVKWIPREFTALSIMHFLVPCWEYNPLLSISHRNKALFTFWSLFYYSLDYDNSYSEWDIEP